VGEFAPVDERARRIGENEAIYREVNERIRGISEQLRVETETMSIVCECGRADCVERIEIDPGAYARIRASAIMFVMASGHEDPSLETVVDRTAGYVVVEKKPGGPAELAEETA
jgi:hypothetical protein